MPLTAKVLKRWKRKKIKNWISSFIDFFQLRHWRCSACLKVGERGPQLKDRGVVVGFSGFYGFDDSAAWCFGGIVFRRLGVSAARCFGFDVSKMAV